jgi:3-hydroxyacyl-[acyl-carrier-protein] dehydratase
MTKARRPAVGDRAGDFLPHKPPFVLLDRIVALAASSGRFAKAVTADDPLTSPNHELSPLLMIEAMAQASGLLLVHMDPALGGRGAVLAAIDRCEMTGTARAGDMLEVETELVRRYAQMARFRCVARVGERQCSVALLTLAVAPSA